VDSLLSFLLSGFPTSCFYVLLSTELLFYQAEVRHLDTLVYTEYSMVFCYFSNSKITDSHVQTWAGIYQTMYSTVSS